MTEVLVAIVGALGLTLVAVISTRTNTRVKAVQHQVQNDHKTNLREELDVRHDETRQWFWALWNRHDRTDKRIDENAARIDHLESRVLTLEQEKDT